MKNELNKFIKKLSLLTLITASAGALIFIYLLPQYYFPTYPISFLVFFVVSLASHFSLLKAFDKSPARQNNYFMLIFFSKIVIYTAFAIIVLKFSPENKKIFVIVLLAQYLIYTIFEVMQILSILKKK